MERGPDTSKRAIGERLSNVRVARGWNQLVLAREMGISTQRWNNYEMGKSFPPPDILARFWQVTGATSDYVLFGRYEGMAYELATKIREVEASLEADAAHPREAGSGEARR